MVEYSDLIKWEFNILSLGARLKEERLRLGFTQTDFARLADASKGSQINWEKDASSPPASALVAFAEVGADTNFILLGIRSEALGGGKNAEKIVSLETLEDQLINPSKYLSDDVLSQSESAIAYVASRAKRRIEEIALSKDPGIEDTTRARADEILREHCNDEDAAERQTRRLARIADRARKSQIALDDALRALNWSIPTDLHHQLLSIIIEYKIKTNDLVTLLIAMKAAGETKA